MARAERAPNDIQRFEDAHLGYIEDVVVALEDWILGDHFTDDDEDIPDVDVLEDLGESLSPPGQPAFNPWRHVGRNDPCPCGSGKKAKRCCLAG
ncbi:MAG: SEC-C domain-containing protein [Alphaproteobacteria bacterium]|nr:SEC-C domain-containing protein [Alphaproteobacteria bacterium]